MKPLCPLGQTKLPAAFRFAGLGTYYSPFYIDTNDLILQAVPQTDVASAFIDGAWISFVVQLNTVLRTVQADGLYEGILNLINYVSDPKISSSLGGLLIEFCTFNNVPLMDDIELPVSKEGTELEEGSEEEGEENTGDGARGGRKGRRDSVGVGDPSFSDPARNSYEEQNWLKHLGEVLRIRREQLLSRDQGENKGFEMSTSDKSEAMRSDNDRGITITSNPTIDASFSAQRPSSSFSFSFSTCFSSCWTGFLVVFYGFLALISCGKLDYRQQKKKGSNNSQKRKSTATVSATAVTSHQSLVKVKDSFKMDQIMSFAEACKAIRNGKLTMGIVVSHPKVLSDVYIANEEDYESGEDYEDGDGDSGIPKIGDAGSSPSSRFRRDLSTDSNDPTSLLNRVKSGSQSSEVSSTDLNPQMVRAYGDKADQISRFYKMMQASEQNASDVATLGSERDDIPSSSSIMTGNNAFFSFDKASGARDDRSANTSKAGSFDVAKVPPAVAFPIRDSEEETTLRSPLHSSSPAGGVDISSFPPPTSPMTKEQEKERRRASLKMEKPITASSPADSYTEFSRQFTSGGGIASNRPSVANYDESIFPSIMEEDETDETSLTAERLKTVNSTSDTSVNIASLQKEHQKYLSNDENDERGHEDDDDTEDADQGKQRKERRFSDMNEPEEEEDSEKATTGSRSRPVSGLSTLGGNSSKQVESQLSSPSHKMEDSSNIGGDSSKHRSLLVSNTATNINISTPPRSFPTKKYSGGKHRSSSKKKKAMVRPSKKLIQNHSLAPSCFQQPVKAWRIEATNEYEPITDGKLGSKFIRHQQLLDVDEGDNTRDSLSVLEENLPSATSPADKERRMELIRDSFIENSDVYRSSESQGKEGDNSSNGGNRRSSLGMLSSFFDTTSTSGGAGAANKRQSMGESGRESIFPMFLQLSFSGSRHKAFQDKNTPNNRKEGKQSPGYNRDYDDGSAGGEGGGNRKSGSRTVVPSVKLSSVVNGSYLQKQLIYYYNNGFFLYYFKRFMIGSNVMPYGPKSFRKFFEIIAFFLCVSDMTLWIVMLINTICASDDATACDNHFALIIVMSIWPGAFLLAPLMGLSAIMLGPSGTLARSYALWSRLAAINNALMIFFTFKFFELYSNSPGSFYLIIAVTTSRVFQCQLVDLYVAHIERLRYTRGWDGLHTSLFKTKDNKKEISL
jgi:hypothetical protein